MCEISDQQTPLLHLHEHPQRVSIVGVLTLTKLRYIWVERNERVRRAEVQRIVDAPIDLIDEYASHQRTVQDERTEGSRLTSRTLRAGWNRPCIT